MGNCATFDQLENYYLIKCFDEKKYRDDFNNGTNIHLKNLQYFWNVDNDFKQDCEGLIWTNCSENVGVTFSLSGFLCCFFLIGKDEVEIGKEKVIFKDEKAKGRYIKYMNEYSTKDDEPSMSYYSVYQPDIFLEIFRDEFDKRGYFLDFDIVSYKNLTMEQRRILNNEGKVRESLFTKPTAYKYQHEFRIFLDDNKGKCREYIEEKGINLRASIIANSPYIHPNLESLCLV